MKKMIQKTYTSIETNFHIALKYSIYLALSFVIIFIIARLTGLAQITEFRFINYIIFYPIGFAAVQKAYKLNHNYIEYFNGLMVGGLTAFMGQLWYAILFFIYLSIDNPFLQYLIAQMPQPLYYPKLSIFFLMMLEGVAVAVILSLTLMQYFKWKRGRWAY